MRIALEDVTADVPEEGGIVTRQVAVAGQPVPAAYDDLVGPDQATDDQTARTSVRTVGTRQRFAGEGADPEHGFGPTHDANAKARAAAGGGVSEEAAVAAIKEGLGEMAEEVKGRLEQTEAKLAEAEQAREAAEAARAEAEASKETAESEARELVKRVEALEEAAKGTSGGGGSAPPAGGKPRGRAR